MNTITSFSDSHFKFNKVLYPKTLVVIESNDKLSFKSNNSDAILICGIEITSILADGKTINDFDSQIDFLNFISQIVFKKGGSAGEGAGIGYTKFSNYEELITSSNFESASDGDLFYIEEEQGFSILGLGNFKPAGLYKKEGDSLNHQGGIEEISSILTNKASINHVHEHSQIENKTFTQFLNYIKSLDSDPVFNYADGLLTQIVYSWGTNKTELNLNYNTNDTLTDLTLTGVLESGIHTTKTLNYDSNDNLIGIIYS